MRNRIELQSVVITEMLAQSRREQSHECCGLLAGRNNTITRAFPATNAAIDPAKTYEIAIPELFQLMREIRAAGLDFLGIYHSHPNSPNEPSPRDLAWAYYPDAAYFILSPLPDVPRPVRAFSIRDARATELEIQIVASEGDAQ